MSVNTPVAGWVNEHGDSVVVCSNGAVFTALDGDMPAWSEMPPIPGSLREMERNREERIKEQRSAAERLGINL